MTGAGFVQAQRDLDLSAVDLEYDYDTLKKDGKRRGKSINPGDLVVEMDANLNDLAKGVRDDTYWSHSHDEPEKLCP